MSTPAQLGLSGRIARRFLANEITPLLALAGLLLGAFALLITPREEEPQIDVTFANVFIAFPGASAREVESLVTGPAEQMVSELSAVKHVYSASRPGLTVLTVQFEVGQPRSDAILRLYNAFYQRADWMPPNMGVAQPLIKPKGIDDVPVLALSLWSEDQSMGAADLAHVAHTLESELQRVKGTRTIETIGAAQHLVRVTLDPQRLAGYGLSVDDLRSALQFANATRDAGSMVADNREILVQAGTLLTSAREVADLVVGMHDGAPIFLRDVAAVTAGPERPVRYASIAGGAAGTMDSALRPTVTIAIGKKPGANAVSVADETLQLLEQLQVTHIPDGVHITVTRNYGETAADKARTLMHKLVFATVSVVLLVLLTLGARAAAVVGAAVGVTLATTLFASWAWGFTLNRVSLFALIFSIGILVDDAIVVVENIHRRMKGSGEQRDQSIAAAVDEVGGPTILATLTVIAALLPLAFVSGLMGPYMRPIPINASTGMLISLVVALAFSPWLYRRLFAHVEQVEDHAEDRQTQRTKALFTRLMTPFHGGAGGKRRRWQLGAAMLALIALSLALVVGRAVILKMLPFDNKSEFQVLVDMPEGTPLEQTQRVLQALAGQIAQIPEVTDYQLYAGTSAPINFNGLVRQYYLRTEPHQGDIQVNLSARQQRSRKSHQIAANARPGLVAIGQRYGATVSIVEVPPGPPVLAPLVAEIYGLDPARLPAVAKRVRDFFVATPDVVDVDDSIEAPQQKLIIAVDRSRAAHLGVSQQNIATTIAAAMRGEDASYLHRDAGKLPIPIRLELSPGAKADPAMLGALRVRARSGELLPLSELTHIIRTTREPTILHKDLLPVVYVTGDVAGATDSPLYGMFALTDALEGLQVEGLPLAQHFFSPPTNPIAWSLKWDGEWQITWEVFRDMGVAYAAGLILIYMLVVAQFRSYGLPLLIMAPIPLTIIGILPGHALLAQPFTAPSMIGMIALAGIIVRNSILLVDFIQQELREGNSLEQATINAAAVRARPIVLTAIAAMMGGFFIIDDPIFGGLAVSLIFGLLVSTVLTLFVIPLLFYSVYWRRYARS